jgi:hypothetical protein
MEAFVINFRETITHAIANSYGLCGTHYVGVVKTLSIAGEIP